MINKEALKKFLIANNKVKVITKNTDEMLQCFEVMHDLQFISREALETYRGPNKSLLRKEIYLDFGRRYATWESKDTNYVIYKKEQRIVI